MFVQAKGLHGLPRLVLFTSADAHYSVKKLASFMGIGSDNVYLINTDESGKMDMNHLGEEVMIILNAKYFFVLVINNSMTLILFSWP